jgi:hypothetical protein
MLFPKSLPNFGFFVWRLSFCTKDISRMELVTFCARLELRQKIADNLL